MIVAIFLAAVLLIVCGHTARTVDRAATRVADSNADLARTITAATNAAAFDKLGRTR